ncbi:unnamed protein product [Peniophora sp. CBMAI 1063]|nr:unnamed protein product [Peniophora sp. CBMAI 1063]
MGGPDSVHAPTPPRQGQQPPKARDLKGVYPDGSIEPALLHATQEHIAQMKRDIELQLLRDVKTVDPPVDADRDSWMADLERASVLAAELDKVLPTFFAYTEVPDRPLGPILSKYLGQMVTVSLQKRLVLQPEPRFILDQNTLRGYIQQFANLLVIITYRIDAVRLELQQLHGLTPDVPPE